jgi:hypothetical protein
MDPKNTRGEHNTGNKATTFHTASAQGNPNLCLTIQPTPRIRAKRKSNKLIISKLGIIS